MDKYATLFQKLKRFLNYILIKLLEVAVNNIMTKISRLIDFTISLFALIYLFFEQNQFTNLVTNTIDILLNLSKMLL